MSPSDLPLSILTNLFKVTVDTKQFNANLKVWVSVGGWAFSDNGTATQGVCGNIAASATDRQNFTDNAINFLNRYGLDGYVLSMLITQSLFSRANALTELIWIGNILELQIVEGAGRHQ